MIGTVIEIFATVVDILFLLWFVPKFNGVTIKERPFSLIWVSLLLLFQLVADRILEAFDLVYAAIDFVLALCFSLSVEKKKRWWNVFSASVAQTETRRRVAGFIVVFHIISGSFSPRPFER